MYRKAGDQLKSLKTSLQKIGIKRVATTGFLTPSKPKKSMNNIQTVKKEACCEMATLLVIMIAQIEVILGLNKSRDSCPPISYLS